MTAQELKDFAADLAVQQTETSRYIKEIGQQLDRLGEKCGGFTEGMAYPSMQKILTERFDIDFMAPRVTMRKNSRILEMDVLACSSSAVFVVEVKSHLREEGVQQMLKILRDFHEFFPSHQGKKVYGILAVVDAPEELQRRVLEEGIYLARIHDGHFEIRVPDSFQPRAF
jgi:hypothetical protein